MANKHPSSEHHHQAAAHHHALRIIIIRRPIITISASTRRQSSTQLPLLNIANSPTNIPRLPTIILKNDDVTRSAEMRAVDTARR